MFPYVLVLFAAVFLALQFVVNKQYQRDIGSCMRTCFFFNAQNGAITAIIFFMASGFKVSATPFSIIMAMLISAVGGAYLVLGFYIMKRGKVAVYMLFVMLGGMILPYIYGVLFLNEYLSLYRIAGILILCTIIILFSLNENNGEKGKKLGTIFWMLCIGVFILNGLLSIITKYHQIASYQKIKAIDFIFWTGIFKFLLFGMFVPFLKKTNVEDKTQSFKAFIYVFEIAILGGVSYICQLLGAEKLDASAMYPMMTGSSIVLSSLSGLIFFREGFDRRSLLYILLIFGSTFLFLF